MGPQLSVPQQGCALAVILKDSSMEPMLNQEQQSHSKCSAIVCRRAATAAAAEAPAVWSAAWTPLPKSDSAYSVLKYTHQQNVYGCQQMPQLPSATSLLEAHGAMAHAGCQGQDATACS